MGHSLEDERSARPTEISVDAAVEAAFAGRPGNHP